MVIVEIPALPPKEASPNWRGHWSTRYRATTDYKNLACVMARNSLRGRKIKALDRATIRATMVVPNRRYIKDGDNAIASLKAAIDGIVAAGILSDDKNIEVMPVSYIIDKDNAPKTIMEVGALRARRRTPPHDNPTQRGNS